MKIKILPSAMEDLQNGYRFYEAREESIGDYFQDSLFSDIDSLILHAGTHRMVYGYYRLLSNRFPYAVYYQMEGSELAVVYRILDMRQSP
ncbi:MAG: type II toxin-antitoxin system RelE/ParE family toxin, partial [Methylococcales bacterium]|nr:type II toxin-antitoxin system RelE/ParE family toxin [Methylococcales bacterium]